MPQTPPGQIFGLNPSNVVAPVQTDADGNLLLAQDTVDAIGAAVAGDVNTANSGYETVAAGQTAQVLGSTGAPGDFLARLIITPAVVACGVVTLLDGATSIPIFVGGGTTALADATPFVIEVNAVCSTAWKITTGASVSVIAVGDFT
jgi:hypothetical protein